MWPSLKKQLVVGGQHRGGHAPPVLHPSVCGFGQWRQQQQPATGAKV